MTLTGFNSFQIQMFSFLNKIQWGHFVCFFRSPQWRPVPFVETATVSSQSRGTHSTGSIGTDCISLTLIRGTNLNNNNNKKKFSSKGLRNNNYNNNKYLLEAKTISDPAQFIWEKLVLLNGQTNFFQVLSWSDLRGTLGFRPCLWGSLHFSWF